MRVDIEKRHIGSYTRIVSEANKAVKKASEIQKKKYEKALMQRNISAENKKKVLTKSLHELIITALSIKKVNLQKLKTSVALIREIVQKIKSINHYMEEGLLRELGVIKKSSVINAVKSNAPIRYLEKSGHVLSKKDIDIIDHTVYHLMQKIIFFDKRLLKQYKKKEVRVIKTQKVGIKDLDKVLKIESELLDVLEAKIPPASKIKSKLFGKDIFNRWAPMVFALLANFEAEYYNEKLIFSKIKKNSKLRKKIENKIKYVINEKESVLKIKEKRALTMKNIKISDDYRQSFHEYVSAASL